MRCIGLLALSRYFEYMQVYALPTGRREVAESKGIMEIVSGFAQSRKAEVQESNSFQRPEIIRRWETQVECE